MSKWKLTYFDFSKRYLTQFYFQSTFVLVFHNFIKATIINSNFKFIQPFPISRTLENTLTTQKMLKIVSIITWALSGTLLLHTIITNLSYSSRSRGFHWFSWKTLSKVINYLATFMRCLIAVVKSILCSVTYHS